MTFEKLKPRRSRPDPDPLVDWLREGLDPTDEQVRRVVGRALLAEPEGVPRERWGWRLSAAVAALAMLAFGFAALILTQKQREKGRPQEGHHPVALITNVSGRIKLVRPQTVSERGAELGLGSHRDGVVEIFNRDECLAAVLPEGKVRYLIIGGDT
jgi:hypothetical protein